MAEGFTFGEEGVRRIVETVRAYERNAGIPPAKRRRSGPTSGVVWQYVTPTAAQTGYWDGVLSLPDATLGDLVDGAAVEIYAVSGSLVIDKKYPARLVGMNGDVSVWLVPDQCSVTRKFITSVCIDSGVITQCYQVICFPSGQVVAYGCETAPPCNELPDPGGGGGTPPGDCCPETGLFPGPLSVEITASSCGILPCTYDVNGTYSIPGYRIYEGGKVYASTSIADVLTGLYTHRVCTVQSSVICSDGSDSPSGTFIDYWFRYWVYTDNSATPMTWEQLVANEGTIADCTIGYANTVACDACLTGAGETVTADQATFVLAASFAACELSLGASPCCETDGFTIDAEISS